MFEDISQIGHFRFEDRQAKTRQRLQIIVEHGSIRLNGMHRLQDAKSKDTSDYTGDLKRQLLGSFKAINAVRDGGLKRVGQEPGLQNW